MWFLPICINPGIVSFPAFSLNLITIWKLALGWAWGPYSFGSVRHSHYLAQYLAHTRCPSYVPVYNKKLLPTNFCSWLNQSKVETVFTFTLLFEIHTYMQHGDVREWRIPEIIKVSPIIIPAYCLSKISRCGTRNENRGENPESLSQLHC